MHWPPVCCSVGVLEGTYVYMSHLAALDSKQPVRPVVEGPSIQGWGQIVTPMVASEWETLLTLHPDDAYRAFLVNGLRDGFRIGYDYGVGVPHPTCSLWASDLV